jgi:hypothetical protein
MELSDNVQQQLYELTAHSDIERQDDKWIPEVQDV